MSKSLLDIINKKLQGLNESENVSLKIKAESEDDKEKIVAALKKEGCKCKENDDGSIVVDVPADQKEKISEIVSEACPDADCNESDDEEDKVDEQDDEDEVNEEKDEEDDEDDKVDEEDDDVDVSEEDDDEDTKNESEEDDEVDEEEDDEEEKKDEDCDGDGKCDEEEDDEVDEEEDDDEVKNEVHEAIRRDIRTIAKTLKLDENALGQVETAFIAAVETRAKRFAKRLAEHEIRKDRRALRKDIRAMNENVNKYLTYVAKEWVKKNEIAIQDKLKVRLAENIIKNIKSTLVENNITVPESNKIVEKYARKIERLEAELNEANKSLVEKSEMLEAVQSAVIVDHVARKKDLTDTQKSKLFKMVEDSLNFDYNTRTSYKERVEMLAEMITNSDASPKKTKKTAKLTEDVEETRMGRYMQYLGQNRFE